MNSSIAQFFNDQQFVNSSVTSNHSRHHTLEHHIVAGQSARNKVSSNISLHENSYPDIGKQPWFCVTSESSLCLNGIGLSSTTGLYFEGCHPKLLYEFVRNLLCGSVFMHTFPVVSYILTFTSLDEAGSGQAAVQVC